MQGWRMWLLLCRRLGWSLTLLYHPWTGYPMLLLAANVLASYVAGVKALARLFQVLLLLGRFRGTNFLLEMINTSFRLQIFTSPLELTSLRDRTSHPVYQ